MLAHSGHVMTLANSIIGVGILAMPFCFQKCGIILSILLLIISNWITRVCCHYLIKSSLLTRRKSFEFLGFHAFGSSGKLLVELCIIGYLLGTCITYFVVVGDLGPQIVTKMFSLETGHVHLRTIIMLVVTLVCILPLGMLKNVDSLSAVCTASVGFYVCLVVKIVLESEEHIIANDWSKSVLYWEPAGILQCLPIFSMALSCQMQLFEVFESVNNQSLEKLNGIVRNATWICTFVYIAVGFFGYVAFCTQTFSGNILMNFSPSFGSDVIKIGFILSIAFSFPLVIFPCRASLYSLLYRKGHVDATGYIPETRFKIITVFIVGFSFCIALVIPSVELVIGLVGSTIGVAICIMFPASCFRKIVRKESTERALAQFILVSGFCFMILGTYANLNAIDEKSSGAHLDVLKIEDNLMKPTQMAIIDNVENLKLVDAKFKVDEFNKEVDLKLQESQVKAENSKKLEIDLNIEKPKEALAPVVAVSAAPPLPVDDKHEEAPIDNTVEKLQQLENSLNKLEVISPMPEIVHNLPKNALINKTETKEVSVKPLDEFAARKTDKNETVPNVIKQQNIDKDAIKKDEEVAAEEFKNNNNKNAKANEDELKKTRKELKKTKELLERTVDELKEELAKQNKETQNLVVEKLGEVVEKVEQMERKVQLNGQQDAPAKEDIVKNVMLEQQKKLPNIEVEQHNANAVENKQRNEPASLILVDAPKENDKVIEKPLEPQIANKGSLLSILKDNASVQVAGAATVQSAQLKPLQQVYEPLSYKTGELMAVARNVSNIEQRLPLPLALLINSAQVAQLKRNASEVVHTQDTKGVKQLPTKIDEMKKLEVLDKNSVKYENKEPVKVEIPKADTIKAVELEKENVEAIRRDILQLKGAQDPSGGSLTPTAIASIRAKRSIKAEKMNFEAINLKLEEENCLSEPKVGKLLAPGLSNAIDFKIQGIGRDLKSLKDEQTR